MRYRLVFVPLSIVLFVTGSGIRTASARTVISPSLTLAGPGVVDQDDMAFWVHPTDLAKSTVITSDKSANKLFVYDLNGNTLQQIPAEEPGNVDTRYGFPLGTDRVDIVAFNERGTNKIRVYKVDAVTRLLEQIDDGNIDSGPNYGIALYRSRRTGKFYVYTGPKVTTPIVQFELVDNGNGTVSGADPCAHLILLLRPRAWSPTMRPAFSMFPRRLVVSGHSTPSRAATRPGRRSHRSVKTV